MGSLELGVRLGLTPRFDLDFLEIELLEFASATARARRRRNLASNWLKIELTMRGWTCWVLAVADPNVLAARSKVVMSFSPKSSLFRLSASAL